jgi:hypothetical protein
MAAKRVPGHWGFPNRATADLDKMAVIKCAPNLRTLVLIKNYTPCVDCVAPGAPPRSERLPKECVLFPKGKDEQDDVVKQLTGETTKPHLRIYSFSCRH